MSAVRYVGTSVRFTLRRVACGSDFRGHHPSMQQTSVPAGTLPAAALTMRGADPEITMPAAHTFGAVFGAATQMTQNAGPPGTKTGGA